MTTKKLKNSQTIILSGSSNPALARKIAQTNKWKFGAVDIRTFSDKETYVNINENIKNKDVFISQSCAMRPNDYLMELLILLDAASNLKPKSLNIILPFYPYRRQNKKFLKGESATAQLVAKLIECIKINSLFVCDIHSENILDFFKTKATNIETTQIFAKYFKKKIVDLSECLIVSPDFGARARAKKLAGALGVKSLVIKKYRPDHDVSKIQKFTGSVKNKCIIIMDDEINTGGTILNTAKELKKRGAKNIYVAATHGIFSGDCLEKIEKSKIDEVVITDTIKQEVKSIKIKALSVANLISDHIK